MKKYIFLLAAVLITGLLLLNTFNFQPYLAVGDHGRDLYGFYRASLGEIPYKDFYWFYGPLSPFYYGFWLKILGLKISSVLIAKSFLTIAIIASMWLILHKLTISPAFALLGSLYFLFFRKNLFYTYHQNELILCLVWILFCAILYLKNNKNVYLYLGAFVSMLLCLIKLNFGVMGLVFTVLTPLITDKLTARPLDQNKIKFYAFALLGVPLIAFGVYYFLLYGLPQYEINQYLCILSPDNQQFAHMPIHKALLKLLEISIFTFRNTAFFCILIALISFRSYFYIQKQPSQERKMILITLGIIFSYYILNLHEFLLSGVPYRLTYGEPMFYAGVLYLFWMGIKTLTERMKIWSFICVITFLVSGYIEQITYIKTAHKEGRFIENKHAAIFTYNPQDWKETVEGTVAFIDKNMKDEPFLALPYDALYYFLTEHKSPTKQIVFLDCANLPLEAEEKIIGELEAQHLRWIVMSNRIGNADEIGIGYFGKTYGKLLKPYIEKNFHIVKTVGKWQQPRGWIENHSVVIWKRKE